MRELKFIFNDESEYSFINNEYFISYEITDSESNIICEKDYNNLNNITLFASLIQNFTNKSISQIIWLEDNIEMCRLNGNISYYYILKEHSTHPNTNIFKENLKFKKIMTYHNMIEITRQEG